MIDISERESSPNRSLERALHLLRAMEEVGRPMGLTELSNATQIAKPTVQRLLSVLQKYGFSEKRQGRYHLGIAVLPLAHSFLLGNELAMASLPVLQELAQASKEAASLFVRLGLSRVAVQRVEGLHPLKYVHPIGERLPLYIGMGKVFAASMPQDELKLMMDKMGEVVLASGERLTRKALLVELDHVRRQGYAVSRNERLMGVTSVSAPVIDVSGETIAVIGVTGAGERFTAKRIEHLSVEVRQAAGAISKRYCRP